MKRILSAVVFVVSIMASEYVAMAEETTTQLKEVVVTATRYEKQAADVPANVTVVTEKDIKDSNAQNIPDLLRTKVGVQVNDITGTQRFYTVDLRGFGETASLNTLVLVDGRRINQADLSGVDWMNIPLERVSRIEIMRGGSGGVLYGDNATGGVINIITKEGEKGLNGGVDLAGGSYGTFKGNAYAGGSVKDLSFFLSGNYLTSDGYRDNSSAKSKNLGLNAAYYVKDFMKIDFSSGYHNDNTGLPGALKESDFAAGAFRTDTKNPNDYVDTKDYYFKLKPEVFFGDENVFRIDVSIRKRDFLSFSSGDWGNFLGDSTIKTTALSPQLVLKQKLGGIKNTLTAGADYQKIDEDIINDSLFFGSRTIGSFTLKKEDFGYYAHDEAGITDALRISGGYRHDRANFNFDPSEPGSVSYSKDAFTAGVNYAFYKKSYVYAGYSRSFRYPVLDEIYSFFNNTISTLLLPQTSDNYEVGVRHYISDDVYANVNVFMLDTEKEIFYNPVSYSNENLDGRTRREGVELSFDAKATRLLDVRGSYTRMKARIEGGTFQGKDVPNVPKDKASVDVTCHITNDFAAILTGVYVGERPFISDFPNDFSDQQSYFLMNAKLIYMRNAVRAFLDINNLTNKEYSEYGVIGGFPLEKAFYPSPKRNFLAGVSIAF